MMMPLHERVVAAADKRPGATAVAFRDQSWTYEELVSRESRLARAMHDAGCRKGDRVCLLLPKQPEAVAAMLAALRLGCVYVPVDLASPVARAARIVETADPRLVLVGPDGADLLRGVLESGVLSPSVHIGAVDDEAVTDPGRAPAFTGRDVMLADPIDAVSVAVDDPAHILFTSGSTGEPKGVVVTHGNAGSFLDWAVPTFGIGPDDRLSGHPPLHFDLSTFDIFGALSTGAELHLVDPQLNVSARALQRFIGDAQLTQWFSVPTTMAFMARFDAVPEGGWPTLRRVLACGEVLPTPVLAHWMRRLPHVTFTNLYGPTEATIASSFFMVPAVPEDETAPVPIGTACPGERLLVLDEELLPVASGETGDLYIGGTGLSPGYWRDEAKTRDAFVRDPSVPGERLYRTGDLARVDEDGVLYFLGRVDAQIKSRGYRIELGEVEAAVNAIDWIAEAAVVGVPSDGFEGTRIACAYVIADGAAVAPAALRARLSTVLPAYMLPLRWLALDELPRNANGKIDRVVLGDLLAEPAGQAVQVR